uniref:AAA-ATPase-like domain-containing protein n=1 Tax=Cacopsylla melanoneura TaxID=428564 RepID=A0A8D8T8Z9_9HEMI
MLTLLVFAQALASSKSCLLSLGSILFSFLPVLDLSTSNSSFFTKKCLFFISVVSGRVNWDTSHTLKQRQFVLNWLNICLKQYLHYAPLVSNISSFKSRSFSLLLTPCLLILICFNPGVGADPGIGDDSDAWEFTYRPRAGDSGREPIDVVEDYLGYFPSPDGANMRDLTLFPSGEPEDYMYVNKDRDRHEHDPDCSSHEKNIKGTIKPGGGKKKTPLKSENFYDIVTQSEIVLDRTLLMKDFFTKKFTKHIHLTRPEGWGKTVALDMIRRFIGLEVDQNGTSFKEVFENLKCELVSLVRSHAHLFPVIKTRRFQPWEKKLYLKFFKNKTNEITVNDVRNCCMTITRATKHFYKMRPMVIFDDFDMPLRSSYEHIFGNRDEVWAIFDMVDDMYEKLVRNFFDMRKLITAGVLPFVRHPHRVFTYMDFHLMVYNLDLHIGIRQPSTTQPPSREWTITKTPYYWQPTHMIDI